MEPVLLGLAAPAAINEAGNLLERSLRAAAEPFAAVLHAVASTLTPNSDVSESSIVDIDDLKSRLERGQAVLANRIEQVLASAGVDLDEPIALCVSEFDGRVEVVGDHPQKALIESALADDDEFAGQFTEMIALAQLLAAADKADNKPANTAELGQAEYEVPLAIFSMDDEVARLDLSRSNHRSMRFDESRGLPSSI